MDPSRQDAAQEKAASAPDDGEHTAFDKMLAHQATAPRSQREADGGFGPSLHRTRQQEVRHVGADDQQKNADQQHQNPERTRNLGIIPRIQPACSRAGDQLQPFLDFGPGRLGHEIAEQRGHCGRGGGPGNTRRKAGHHVHRPKSRPERRDLGEGVATQRSKDIDPFPGNEAEEPWRRDADNPSGLVVDPHGAADRVWVAAEATRPEPVADNDNRLGLRPVFLFGKGPSSRQSNTEFVEEVPTDVEESHLFGRRPRRGRDRDLGRVA